MNLSFVFNRDLALIHHPITPHSSKDLAKFTDLAKEIKHWTVLASQIEKAAQVSQRKNLDVTGQ